MARPNNPAQQTAPVPASAEPVFPTLSIIEKRIASGGQNLTRPRNVPLVNQQEPMVTRIVNGDIPGRYWQITEELGWVPVTPVEVGGGLSGDMREQDGRVVMGEKGLEILVKMPKRLFDRVQHAKAERQDREMRSKSAMMGRTQRSMEDEAKSADRPGAEQLERAASRLPHLEIDKLNVGTERVLIAPPGSEI